MKKSNSYIQKNHQGISIQVKDFAQYIEKNYVCLVTVNNSKYWTYRYKGNLNGIDKEIV